MTTVSKPTNNPNFTSAFDNQFHVYDAPLSPLLDVADALTRRTCQLRSLIAMLYNNDSDKPFSNFDSLNSEIRENYCWLASDLVDEIQYLICKQDDIRRGVNSQK